MKHEVVLILDFGGQYTQLIARRIREANVYCEILPFDAPIDRIKSLNPKGIILTGGPASVTEADAPFCVLEVFELGVPVLGICYGMQLMSVKLGGEVAQAEQREYGKAEIAIDPSSQLFYGLEKRKRKIIPTLTRKHHFVGTNCTIGIRKTA